MIRRACLFQVYFIVLSAYIMHVFPFCVYCYHDYYWYSYLYCVCLSYACALKVELNCVDSCSWSGGSTCANCGLIDQPDMLKHHRVFDNTSAAKRELLRSTIRSRTSSTSTQFLYLISSIRASSQIWCMRCAHRTKITVYQGVFGCRQLALTSYFTICTRK